MDLRVLNIEALTRLFNVEGLKIDNDSDTCPVEVKYLFRTFGSDAIIHPPTSVDTDALKVLERILNSLNLGSLIMILK